MYRARKRATETNLLNYVNHTPMFSALTPPLCSQPGYNLAVDEEEIIARQQNGGKKLEHDIIT